MMHGQMQYGNSNAISNEGWSLSWGDALNTLPGSDDERARRAAGPSRFPSYRYLLDISFDHHLQSAVTLFYPSMLPRGGRDRGGDFVQVMRGSA
jgi:hypothetical protein